MTSCVTWQATLAIALVADRAYLLPQSCSAPPFGDRPDAAPARIATLSNLVGFAPKGTLMPENESDGPVWPDGI
ncbi:hypothetical protein [Ensifer sp. LC163]|uniref:hypothetical protein n=1 Tax=Ensifer sp. LC163 TaxID=1120652 RepID=UPI000AA3D6FB|nr:hypothetical protein [Ensifer sp. LC163]